MANLTPTIVVFAAFLAVESAPLAAQSYRDFTLVRNRQQPYKSLLQIRAGWRATDPEGENTATGLVKDDSIDGFLLYHSKELSAREDWALDFYAGQDGLYLSVPLGHCLLEIVHLAESARYHLYNLNELTTGKVPTPKNFPPGMECPPEVVLPRNCGHI